MRRLLLACCLLPALAGAAIAAETVPFVPAAFARAQAEKKPILVEIDAGWCPTCAQQRPILARLSSEPKFRDLVIMKVDFDTQKDVVRSMRATMQSTLIAFHGEAERGRATGITDEAEIRALVEKTGS